MSLSLGAKIIKFALDVKGMSEDCLPLEPTEFTLKLKNPAFEKLRNELESQGSLGSCVKDEKGLRSISLYGITFQASSVLKEDKE